MFKVSIRWKLLLPLVFAVVSLLLIIHTVWIPKYLSDEEKVIHAQESAYIEALGISLIPSLLSSDLAQIHATLNAIVMRKKQQWISLRLITADGIVLYPLEAPKETKSNNLFTISQPIYLDQDLLAVLIVQLDSASQLDSGLKHLAKLEIYLILFSLFISVFSALLLDRWIRQPLKAMVSATEKIIEGDFSHNLRQNSMDEVGQLADSINQMQSQLDARQKETALQNRILQVIANAQSRFIRDTDPQQLFNDLLNDILTLTQSEYGFLGEVLFDGDRPYLKTFAITNIAWDDPTREFYASNAPNGLEFRNLQTLFGSAITNGEIVVANDPKQDFRSTGIPQGHPPLHAFLGMPFKRENKVIGMFGIANRPGGYNDTLIRQLKPIVNTCTQIVEAYKAEQNRLRIEKLEREREIRMRTIVNNITEGIITIDDKGIIEGFNPAAENIFGYLASEVVGSNINILVPDDHCNKHDGYISNYLRHGESNIVGQGRVLDGKRKDGSVFPLELTVSEMWVENERLFCGVMRDVTERNKLDKMKNEFVSTVSHELRTPLTSIRGSLGILTSGKLGEFSVPVTSLLNIASNNSERLLLLINDLLDMEKLASGNVEFQFQETELAEFLRNVMEANQGYGEQHNVNFVLTECDPNLVVYADRNRLMQVLSNLLSNAAKFSPEGSNVETAAIIQDGKIRITVSDRGSGIPEEFGARIFERFIQADSSSTRRVGGTGLGLNIAKAIVEKHQGTIGYTANPLGGTIFYVDLPILEHNVHAINQ